MISAVNNNGFKSFKMLDAATTVSTGDYALIPANGRTVKAKISGTGAVSATVELYGNTEPAASGGILRATFTLSGTTTDQAGTFTAENWPYLYAKITAITGTGAAVTCEVSA